MELCIIILVDNNNKNTVTGATIIAATDLQSRSVWMGCLEDLTSDIIVNRK